MCPIPRVDNYDVIRAKFIVDSLDHKMMTTFSKNANEFRDEGRVRSNSIKIIKKIEKEIKKSIKDVSKDDLDVIEIDLSPIKTKKREKVLETIHNIYQAERIDDILFIKFDGFVKGEMHMALLYSLDQQLTWDILIDTISVVNGNEFRPDIGATWVRLENVLKNEKVKLQESSNKKYKQTLKLAKIFKDQFKDCHNKFTEEQIEYKFFYAQTYTTYFFNRGKKMLKASAILKNESLQDNYRCSHGNKIGLVMSISDIKIRKCDHGSIRFSKRARSYPLYHKFYVYSMCMPFSAKYYFKLEFKLECPITMRTFSKELPKFGQNLWKMRDLVQPSVTEIMTYIDSEEGEENDGAVSVDTVNQSPRKEPNPEVDDSDEEEEVEMMVISDKEALNSLEKVIQYLKNPPDNFSYQELKMINSLKSKIHKHV
nr:6285_t:CDS:10 [Entrophospora candida]